ncbi:MAG: hypothetical protein KC636_19465, partial [Myxococcales bacterium]|nr:hypothetical protein [Myxococcales bacterium]
MSRPRALPHGLKDIARVAALASLCWPLACAPPAAAPAPSPESPAKAPASTQEPVAEAAAPAPAGPTTPVLLVTARDVLDPLTQAGLDLGARAFGQTATSLAELATAPAYRDLRDTLARDLEADAARDPRAGVGMKHPHRQFDITWLDSDKTRFELIAAVNRVDRRPFAPERCGETRLIYRLAYSTTLAGEPLSSRLPMTVNVVFWQDPEGAAEGDRCRDVARRWLAPEGLSGAALARWLTRPEGPLAPERLTAARLKSVEVNLQSVRWPSVVHPSLAGHAEYILRVFHPRDGRLAPAPIENTPDVERLRRDDAARAELLTWLKDPERLAAIEAGTVNVPERFLADKAVSVTPRALARIANRPYAQLFQPS